MNSNLMRFFKVFKAVVFLGLLYACCHTTYYNIMDFMSEKRSMSVGVVHQEKGLELPAITICNKTAYKNTKRNLNLEDYLANTMDKNDFYLDLYYSDFEDLSPECMY